MGYKVYKSRDEMKQAGYTFEGSSECSKCGVRIEWARTKNGKKVPFNVGSTVCHFDTCDKPAAQQQAPQSAANARPASNVAQELTVAVRALNTNVIELNSLLKALLARLSHTAQTGATEASSKPNGTGAMVNSHGLHVSDEDVPF